MHETRPSKKQRELLSFISSFIKEQGYGPSYREIMRALDYKSVSTVAIHIDSLITKGYLRKTDHSARSLEVIGEASTAQSPHETHLKWLKHEIQKRTNGDAKARKEAIVLSSALDILDQTAD